MSTINKQGAYYTNVPQSLDPEVAPDSTGLEVDHSSSGPESYRPSPNEKLGSRGNGANPSGLDRRVLGLKPVVAWILLFVLVLILASGIGAGVGAGLAAKGNDDNNSNSSADQT